MSAMAIVARENRSIPRNAHFDWLLVPLLAVASADPYRRLLGIQHFLNARLHRK